MANPPSYEESTSEAGGTFDDSKTDPEAPQRLSIREEVGVSRSQHVAAIVASLLPQIRERAKNGLSKSTIALLPSNQDPSQGPMAGWPEEELPLLIQLEGPHDTLEFWTQQEALDQLQSQTFAAVAGFDAVAAILQPPERPAPPPTVVKSGLFGRKSKAPGVKATSKPAKAPVTVDVQLDELYFRSESQYGLLETLRSRCVLLTIDVR